MKEPTEQLQQQSKQLQQQNGLAGAPVERIRLTVARLPVTHCDETGWRVAGKLHRPHCARNEHWRYCTVQEKRGR